MASIVEEVVIIKFSKLVKNGESGVPDIAGNDVLSALEQVSQELVGDSIVVEVEKA